MTLDIICPKCNFTKTIPKEKIPSNTRFVICPQCRNRFDLNESNPEFVFAEKEHNRLKNTESPRTKTAWESRDTIGTWPSIYSTFKSVLFSPGILFRTMSYDNGIKEPFAFGLLMGSIGAMVSLFWQFLFMSSESFNIAEELPFELPTTLIFLFTLIILPFSITIFMFVYSGIIHLCLTLLRGTNSGYEGTFRVFSYSMSSQLFLAIPIIGGLVSSVWYIIISFIGLREIHETSYLKIFFALLIPILFIMLIAVTIVLSISRLF